MASSVVEHGEKDDAGSHHQPEDLGHLRHQQIVGQRSGEDIHRVKEECAGDDLGNRRPAGCAAADQDGGCCREGHHHRGVIQFDETVALGVDADTDRTDDGGQDDRQPSHPVDIDPAEPGIPLVLADGEDRQAWRCLEKEIDEEAAQAEKQQQSAGNGQRTDLHRHPCIENFSEIAFQADGRPHPYAADRPQHCRVGEGGGRPEEIGQRNEGKADKGRGNFLPAPDPVQQPAVNFTKADGDDSGECQGHREPERTCQPPVDRQAQTEQPGNDSHRQPEIDTDADIEHRHQRQDQHTVHRQPDQGVIDDPRQRYFQQQCPACHRAEENGDHQLGNVTGTNDHQCRTGSPEMARENSRSSAVGSRMA